MIHSTGEKLSNLSKHCCKCHNHKPCFVVIYLEQITVIHVFVLPGQLTKDCGVNRGHTEIHPDACGLTVGAEANG